MGNACVSTRRSFSKNCFRSTIPSSDRHSRRAAETIPSQLYTTTRSATAVQPAATASPPTDGKPPPQSRPREPGDTKRVSGARIQEGAVLRSETGDLTEKYSIGRELGRGRFGTTYLCVEKATGREYACKSIAKRRLAAREDAEDVRREIQIMRHLAGGHPGIVSIHGAYEDAAAVHVVMELCAGRDLFDRIASGGRYADRKAAELARAIVAVVESCHSLGVMHRDVKPENFLFVGDDDSGAALKMVDFGLSTFFRPGEMFTEVVGSPYYVAPEVLKKRYGQEADVWSAGVVIYILLCGVPPFWAETEHGVFEQVLHGSLDLENDPWPSVSEDAKDLLRKMLVRDPKKRLTARQVLSHPWLHKGSDLARNQIERTERSWTNATAYSYYMFGRTYSEPA